MKTSEDSPIIIQDDRPFDFLWMEREIFRPSPNGDTWAALLQPTCLSIYACLCQHASTSKGKPRQSYPSYATIARECGISRRAAIDGIAKLLKFGFIRQGEKTALRTNTFVITAKEKWNVASDGRKTRNDKGTPRKIMNDIHHEESAVIVNNIHSDSECYSPLIVNNIHSDSECYSPEVKSLKKSHLKESQRERETAKPNSSKAETNARSLSSSPSGMVFLSFFRDESEHLSTAQIRMICDISDSDLFKAAIEYLQGNGVKELYRKVSLIKTKMQELAAAASVQPGAGGVASPARFGQDVALLDERGNPKAFTMKAKQARANMAFFDNILTAAASDVIDIQPLTAIAGA